MENKIWGVFVIDFFGIRLIERFVTERQAFSYAENLKLVYPSLVYFMAKVL